MEPSHYPTKLPAGTICIPMAKKAAPKLAKKIRMKYSTKNARRKSKAQKG